MTIDRITAWATGLAARGIALAPASVVALYAATEKPAVPVAPEEPTPPSHNPFRSPFDDTYHGSTGSRSGDSTKNPAAPSGTNGNNAPIPPPLTNTNAPPANTD